MRRKCWRILPLNYFRRHAHLSAHLSHLSAYLGGRHQATRKPKGTPSSFGSLMLMMTPDEVDWRLGPDTAPCPTEPALPPGLPVDSPMSGMSAILCRGRRKALLGPPVGCNNGSHTTYDSGGIALDWGVAMDTRFYTTTLSKLPFLPSLKFIGLGWRSFSTTPLSLFSFSFPLLFSSMSFHVFSFFFHWQ